MSKPRKNKQVFITMTPEQIEQIDHVFFDFKGKYQTKTEMLREALNDFLLSQTCTCEE